MSYRKPKYLPNSVGLFVLILICLVFILNGCSGEDKTYSIKGRVELVPLEKYGVEAPKDFTDVTVLVYRAVAIDPIIADLNASYPNHGVIFDQHVAFDHRLATPVASVLTTADGQFAFNRLSAGRYNLVAYRDDWGFKYLLDLNVLDDVSGLVMLVTPVIDLPPQISSDFQMIDGVVYRSTGNLIVLPDQVLSVTGTNKILLAPGSSVSVYGGINTTDSTNLTFVSSDKTYTHSQTEVERFTQIDLIGVSDQILQGFVIRDSSYGLKLMNCERVNLVNSTMDGKYQSIALSNSPDISIFNCVLSKSTDLSLGALYAEFSDNLRVERSVFLHNQIGITLIWGQQGLVKNNYFSHNLINDVYCGTNATTTVENNTFQNSNTSITNYAGVLVANYNDIAAETGIHSYYLHASFTAKHNNLDCSDYGIISKGRFQTANLLEMDSTQNYWFTTQSSTIREKIYDHYNEDPNDPIYYVYVTVVKYQPFAMNRIQNAGIFN